MDSGQLLWNVLYDGLLSLLHLREVQIIGYADDIAEVAKELDQVLKLCNLITSKIKKCLTAINLRLAGQKLKQC